MLIFRFVDDRENENEWIAHIPDYGGTKRGLRKALRGWPTIVQRDPQDPRRFYLKSLFAYPEHGWNGTRVLRAVRAFVADRCAREGEHECELLLQDQSFRSCKNSHLVFSLGFRSMLEYGRTWYEKNGFKMIETDDFPRRDEIARALRNFKNLRVEYVIRSLRESVESASRSRRCREMRSEALRILHAWSVAGGRHPRLGKCLLAMPCEDYAMFLQNAYPIVSPNLVPCARARKSIEKCQEESPVHGRDVFDKASVLQNHPYRVSFRACVQTDARQ